MSPKMAAIVAFIIGLEPVTKPSINGLYVTSDRFVLAQLTGDIGYNEFIGAESDLDQNFRNLMNAAKLTKNQRAQATLAYMRVIHRV